MIKKYNQIARIKMSKQPTTNKYIDYNFNPLFLITHNKHSKLNSELVIRRDN